VWGENGVTFQDIERMRVSDKKNLTKSGRGEVYKISNINHYRFDTDPYKEAWPQVEAALYAIQNSTPSMARVYTIGSGGRDPFQMKSARKNACICDESKSSEIRA